MTIDIHVLVWGNGHPPTRVGRQPYNCPQQPPTMALQHLVCPRWPRWVPIHLLSPRHPPPRAPSTPTSTFSTPSPLVNSVPSLSLVCKVEKQQAPRIGVVGRRGFQVLTWLEFSFQCVSQTQFDSPTAASSFEDEAARHLAMFCHHFYTTGLVIRGPCTSSTTWLEDAFFPLPPHPTTLFGATKERPACHDDASNTELRNIPRHKRRHSQSHFPGPPPW